MQKLKLGKIVQLTYLMLYNFEQLKIVRELHKHFCHSPIEHYLSLEVTIILHSINIR